MTERTLGDLREAYLRHMSLECDATRQTIGAYRKDFRILTAHLPPETPLLSITPEQIRTWVEGMHHLSPRTRRRRLGTIQRAIRWAIEEGWMVQNPFARVRLPRMPALAVPDVPTFEEVQRLLAGIAAGGRHRRRDLAAFSLLYSAALRESELCSLRIGDLDLDRRTARVLGKGRKLRVVHYDEATQRALRIYLATRSDRGDPTRPVILSQTGGPWGPTGVRGCLRRHLIRLGIGRRIWVHGLRHARATHLYGATRNLRFVQEMLGHANPATTTIYTHVDMQTVYDEAVGRLANRPEGPVSK